MAIIDFAGIPTQYNNVHSDIRNADSEIREKILSNRNSKSIKCRQFTTCRLQSYCIIIPRDD